MHSDSLHGTHVRLHGSTYSTYQQIYSWLHTFVERSKTISLYPCHYSEKKSNYAEDRWHWLATRCVCMPVWECHAGHHLKKASMLCQPSLSYINPRVCQVFQQKFKTSVVLFEGWAEGGFVQRLGSLFHNSTITYFYIPCLFSHAV